MPSNSNDEFKRALCAEQLSLFDKALTPLLLASASCALTLGLALGSMAAGSGLWWWFAAIACALGLRYFAARFPMPARASTPTALRWRHRAGSAAHGLAWSLAATLGHDDAGALGNSGHDLVILALATVAAVAIVASAFDLLNGLAFAAPTSATVAWHLHLFSQSPQHLPVPSLIVGLVMGVALFTGMLAHRAFRAAVAQRLAESRRTAEALRSTTRLDRIGRLAGVGAWEMDVDTGVMQCSAQTCRTFDIQPGGSHTLQDVLGLFATEDRQHFELAVARAVNSVQPFDLELSATTALDRSVSLRILGQPWVKDGKVVRIDGAMQDITQLRAMDRELADGHRLHEQLLQNTEQGIWFLDNAGRTTDANLAMCRLLGRPRQEVLGRSVLDFFSGADLDILNLQLALRREGRKGGYEIGIAQPDGTRVECFNNATPIYDAQGLRVGSVGMWTDLTALKRTQELLRHREAELRAVLTGFPGYIAAIERDLRYSFVNAATAQLLGGTEQDIVGRPISDFLTPQPLTQMKRDIESRAKSPGEPCTFERTFGGRDGLAPITVQVIQVAGPRRADGGQTFYTFGIDISARKAQQEAAERHSKELQTLLEALPGFIASFDQDARYLFINDAMAQVLGRPRDEILGHTVDEVSGTQPAREARDEFVRLDQGGVSLQLLEVPSSGAQPPLAIQMRRVAGPPDGLGRRRYYAFGTDVSELRRSQNAMQAAKEDAERASQAKSQFLSHMSHELRTPLNAILGFAQLLESDRSQPLIDTQQLHVHEILWGARHLLSLINSLLDMGSIEAGRFTVRLGAVPVHETLREALALMQPLAAQHHIALPAGIDAATDLCVAADRTRLVQVLINLLGNAIKYSRSGGAVSVECHSDSGKVRLAVIDQGVGLTPEQQAQLFIPFERLHAEGSGIEGTGIGLALSRRLVEAMGGEIGVDSSAGHGSTFWVRLACAPFEAAVPIESGAPATPIEPSGRPRRRYTVLYIEDNPVNLMVTQAMMGRLPGVDMISAEDGKQGLAAALEQRPDLILTDIQMPVMDGFEMLRQLRLNQTTRDIPVIAISADALPSAVERGRAAGFVDYLTKPVQMPALHALVRRTLALGRPEILDGAEAETR